MPLQSNVFGQIDFINKKSPDDLRIGCKSPSSLVEFIDTNVYLKELEELKFFWKR